MSQVHYTAVPIQMIPLEFIPATLGYVYIKNFNYVHCPRRKEMKVANYRL